MSTDWLIMPALLIAGYGFYLLMLMFLVKQDFPAGTITWEGDEEPMYLPDCALERIFYKSTDRSWTVIEGDPGEVLRIYD